MVARYVIDAVKEKNATDLLCVFEIKGHCKFPHLGDDSKVFDGNILGVAPDLYEKKDMCTIAHLEGGENETQTTQFSRLADSSGILSQRMLSFSVQRHAHLP